MLPFLLNLQPGEPIYEQIVRSVKRAVALGDLEVGQQMPSVRTISREIGVNPNTVQKAVTRLTEEGVLETRPGQGCYVADRHRSSRGEWRGALEPLIDQLLIESAHHGLTVEELSDLIFARNQKSSKATKNP